MEFVVWVKTELADMTGIGHCVNSRVPLVQQSSRYAVLAGLAMVGSSVSGSCALFAKHDPHIQQAVSRNRQYGDCRASRQPRWPVPDVREPKMAFRIRLSGVSLPADEFDINMVHDGIVLVHDHTLDHATAGLRVTRLVPANS
jgi:hypothetical protein